jgi:ribose 5-phosphate isomerase A
LIKGYGGALLREKLVALAARRFIVVADDSKLVHRLGEHGPVPVEVVRFAWHTTRVRIEQLGCHVELRRETSGDPFVTDEGHYVLDCHFAANEHPQEIAQALKSLVGVVEHGLFLGIATDVVIAHQNGAVEWRQHSYTNSA